jgi:hypothetical protein
MGRESQVPAKEHLPFEKRLWQSAALCGWALRCGRHNESRISARAEQQLLAVLMALTASGKVVLSLKKQLIWRKRHEHGT